MKKLLLPILILLSIGVKAQYHIQVRCFGPADDEQYQSYVIYFTGDNWNTEYPIRDAFDVSSTGDTLNVNYIERIFMSLGTAKQEAIDFAKNFKTYKQCIEYNDHELKRYRQLYAYRKAHPIKTKPPVVKKACCKLIQVY